MKTISERVLQDQISTSDKEWRYEISDLADFQGDHQAGKIKSIRVVSNPRSQGIFLQWIPASINRATRYHPLEDLVQINFKDFRHITDDDGSRPGTHKQAVEYIERLLSTGVILNGMLFSFYGHSNSQLKSRSCYLLKGSKNHVRDKVHNLGEFSKIKTVAKMAKRIGLLFSTADIVLDISPKYCRDIEDIERDGFVFTDGCGLISKPLAKRLSNKKPITFHDRRYLPSVYQIRYRGYKGVVIIDPHMEQGIWLKFRKSMKKVNGADDISFAVVEHSKPYVYGYLNDEIVLLLHALGITQAVFLKKQAEYFSFLESCRTDPRCAFRLLSSRSMVAEAEELLIQGSGKTNKTVRTTISQEYGSMVKEKWDNEKVQKIRILIPKSRLLFGVCDPLDILKPDECFLRVTLDEFGAPSTITGANVLISRNPTLHPGDLRKLRAVDRPELYHLTDCVVFSTKGKRPTADLMSGGDLDGDTFFVCWDHELIPKTLSEAAEYPGVKEAARFSPIGVDDLIAYFAAYNSMSLGRVKKLFLGWARAFGPHCSQCQELNRLFSQCVDGNRIKIPDALCDPPQPSPDAIPFILDVLHEHAAAHWETVKAKVTHLDECTSETLVDILSSPCSLSELELAKMTLAWCRTHEVPFSEFWTFFDPSKLQPDEQAWLLSELPASPMYANFVRNGLHQSNILTRQDLEAFQLDHHALHWKCVFASNSEPIRSLMATVTKTFPYFAKKLLILGIDERLTVAIYFPQPLQKGEDTVVDSSVRLFAFPHTHKEKYGHRRVVPTKKNYRFYYGETIMQLYENHRRGTFVYFTHSAEENSSYGDLVEKGERLRARQKKIDDDTTCDWRISIALERFSTNLRTQIGRTNRAPITSAELYVISNKDVQALRILDLWLESVDTMKVLPNFPDEKEEYTLPTLNDVEWERHSDFIKQAVCSNDISHALLQANSVQIVELLQFCYQYHLDKTISRVYNHLVVASGEPLALQCTTDTLNDLIDFLHYKPTLAIYFARLCPWVRLPNRMVQILEMRAIDLLHAMLLSANRVGLMVVQHIQAVLLENISLSLAACKDFVETAALVVGNPELLLSILMDCQAALSRSVQEVGQESMAYFIRNMYGLAFEHCDEAAENHEMSPGIWSLSPQESTTDKTLCITSRRRIDAPRLSRIAMGDHVRFVVNKEPVNSTIYHDTSFDACVEAASDNEVRFRCFCQPPSFIQKCSWSLKHCGPFITAQAAAEALLELLLKREECCGVYKSLMLPQHAPDNAAIISVSDSDEKIQGLNTSQSRAVCMSLRQQLTCLWGPPGTGKTTTLVALLQVLLKNNTNGRVLVAAPTHNAVDNVLRQYVRRALRDNGELPQPVRVSTELSKVADDVKNYTCDAMLGKDLNQYPAAKRKAIKRIAESRLVFTTCVGAALGLLRKQTFETVIIDEASQQTEPATIIPLVKGCQRVVLVGDHVQLRATIGKHATTLDFDISLMERLWTSVGSDPSIGRMMLDTQYRMHPDICDFPSSEFYQGQLLTAESCASITVPSSNFPWPVPPAAKNGIKPVNSRCVFVQCHEKEDYGRKSKTNPGQAAVCKQIIALLTSRPTERATKAGVAPPPGGEPPTIAILTPYARQADLIRESCPNLQVSSIDGFQGQEADIIIFVTVRCNDHGEIGFLKDMRRLNVALTRAKAGVILIGDQSTLKKKKDEEDACRVWERLINAITKVKLPAK